MATYASRLSAQGRVQHEPLGKALEQYSGAKNRAALIALLTPIQRAAEKSQLAKELVDSGDVYHPLAWTPQDAYRFLQEIPLLRELRLNRTSAGLVERSSVVASSRSCECRQQRRIDFGH